MAHDENKVNSAKNLYFMALEHNNTEHHEICREVFQLENTLIIICINLF